MECPEAVEKGRNFRLLAEDELPQLLDFLAGYLPESLKFHQTLLTYMRDRVWEFYFYVANGWPEEPICLHFPGMTLSQHGLLYESVGVFCPNEQLDLLRLVREEDVLIDWSKPLYINFVHSDIAGELIRLYEDRGTVERVLGDVWACQDPERLEQVEDENVDADQDVQVLPLKPEHAEGIYELYPANDMECHEVFLRLIGTLPAAGVFVKGSLAAWMVQSYYGAMFSMQTKPEYRRKGYGTKLARYLTKLVMERGYSPFVVIRPENEASQSLYTKLGFQKLYQMVRMTFAPSAWLDGEECEPGNGHWEEAEAAIRRASIERRVCDALAADDEPSTVTVDIQDVEGDETIRDAESPIDADVLVEEPAEHDERHTDVENGLPREEDVLEPIAEQPEDRIEVVEVTEVLDESGNVDGGDGGDGGGDD